MTGGMNAMILYWMSSFWIENGASAVCLLLLFIASVALIRINDWYCSNEARGRATSIRELETLFALEDYREHRSYRPGRQS
jgi:multisubunit Na+/H+ antiporter MnhG subunit